MLLHASCVAIDHQAVLLAGPPGSGKSDLALRLIDAGAQLIADDQTELTLEKSAIIASAPASIKTLIEIRHIGLMKMPVLNKAPVALYVELTPSDEKLERLPEPATIILLDQPIRQLRLPSFAASTPAKIRAALKYPLLTDP